MVISQLAAADSEDRRPVGKACPQLLDIIDRELSAAAPVRKYVAAYGGSAGAMRIFAFGGKVKPIWTMEGLDEEASELMGLQSASGATPFR